MRRVVLLLAFLSVPACVHQPPTIITPQGHVAFTADQIVQRVNELQNAAIAAEANQALPTKTARLIVTFCVDADKTLAATPQGWQKTVATAWAQVKSDVGVIPNATIAAAMNAVDAALASLGA